ncbi:DUF7133 domain-containing protein [Portibacter lacus]|uniref:Glucose dehydrogenase n=1 Tax=Portibacter lacus TaxID=1099794 RepID=A0AA37SQ01_9BACT|nr:HEAT repeat domain-containing protein [Portibacter lacus]GLR18653.1 glucose dehydrogenase [Portibacter lacus]
MKIHLVVGALALLMFSCTPTTTPTKETFKTVRSVKAENALSDAKKIREEVAVQVADGMELSLWGSDSLVHDPIAISIDPQGRIFYTSATRQENSEFDIRGHRNWMTASISFETAEDRRAFLKETFTENSEESEKFLKDLNEDGVLDWKDLAVQKEEIWYVADEDNDGVAETSRLYLKDFNQENTDVANGILAHDGEIYLAVAPDLWRISDTDNNGIGDKTQSLINGFAVHIGFSGHGMSGVTIGPQGRIWWGIGDIGMNATDKDGNKWEYPNQGVIVRSDPDGSNFEVYAAGVRNTHEFVFDKYGNLITEDNDGDHRGERERLMYVINGSDAGWRTNWQFGKYTDPNNNSYKVWIDEKMSIPYWEGQAAYIIPPIQNYVNGPTGMVYNPGTALGEKWNDHFFIAEFRGNPANSPIHAFTMEPNGAGFKLGETQEVVSGLLPTGLDFGPDGALYFGDWIDGWGTKDKGRIWKLDVPAAEQNPLRKATQRELTMDYGKLSTKNLIPLLEHDDMRVRLKAQFEIAKKGKPGIAAFHTVLSSSKNQMSIIHSIWGLSQIARKDKSQAAYLTKFINHIDPEIKAQAIKMLGDVRYAEAGDQIIPALKDKSLRVQMIAAEALGRMKFEGAKEELIDLIRSNNGKDLYIRHAASYALSLIGDDTYLASFNNDPSYAVRIGAVVALRRMSSDQIKVYLTDKNELIVTEAARAINDDRSIMGAMPDLAALLNTTNFKNEALIRRAINANFRLAEKENIDQLIKYAQDKRKPDAMRAEAMACLSTWENPSPLDRVDGRNRKLTARDGSYVKSQMNGLIDNLLTESSENIQIEVISAISRLKMSDRIDDIENLYTNSKSEKVKIESLEALSAMNFEDLDMILQDALSSDNKTLRAQALSLIPKSSIDEESAVTLFADILENGSDLEQKSTYAALAGYTGKASKELLSSKLELLKAGDLKPELALDLLEAAGDSIASVYHEAKPDGPLKGYEETLYGGSVNRGKRIFFNNEAAQCVRCHSIYEWGGDAGPGLAGIANKITSEQILEALLNPSARLAPGFGVLSVTLNDDSTVAGVLEAEDEATYTLKVSKDESKVVQKSNVKTQSFLPSSMPAMDKILDKKELRDLVAFLSSLKGEEL